MRRASLVDPHEVDLELNGKHCCLRGDNAAIGRLEAEFAALTKRNGFDSSIVGFNHALGLLSTANYEVLTTAIRALAIEPPDEYLTEFARAPASGLKPVMDAITQAISGTKPDEDEDAKPKKKEAPTTIVPKTMRRANARKATRGTRA